MPVTEEAVRPPADYHPDGLATWIEDRQDVFFVAPELRAIYSRDDAPPSKNDLRKLYDGEIQLQRVIRDPKGGYRAAPDIVNTGPVALVRPVSIDLVKVDPFDTLHVAAWRHTRRLRWAETQHETEKQTQEREAAQPRCQICATVLYGVRSSIGPWTKGRGHLCQACADTINLAGALRHLEQHRGAIEAFLSESPSRP